MEYYLLTESHKSSRINNEDKHVIIYYLQHGKLEKESQNLCYESSFLSFCKIVFSYIESSFPSRHKFVAGSDDGDQEPINCVLLSGSLSRVVWAHWIFYHPPWISDCKTVANIVCLFPHNKRLAVYSS